MTDKLLEEIKPALYCHQILNTDGKKSGVYLGTPSRAVCEQAHTEGETDKEILAYYSEEQVRALLSRALPEGHVVVPGWMPIESAPKDGRRILSWALHSIYPVIVGWDSDCKEWEDLYGDHIYHLIHWMPLPAAPANKEG